MIRTIQMNLTIKEADRLVDKGDSLTDPNCMERVRGYPFYDEAKECYLKAAKIYQYHHDWRRQHDALVLALGCIEKQKYNTGDMNKCYTDLAICCERFDKIQAIKYLKEFNTLLIEQGNFRRVSKNYEKIAELVNQKKKKHYLKKAYDVLLCDNSMKTDQMNLLVKIGQIEVVDANYKEAFECFYQYVCETENIYKCDVCLDYLLCALVLKDLDQVKDLIDKYSSKKYFDKSKENKFLLDLESAIDSSDLNKFNQLALKCSSYQEQILNRIREKYFSGDLSDSEDFC